MKAPSKVRVFIRTINLNRLNANDLLQTHTSQKLVSPICALYAFIITQNTIIITFAIWDGREVLTTFMFFVRSVCLWAPTLVIFVSTSLCGFGRNKEHLVLYRGAIFAGLWVLWLKGSARRFKQWFIGK